MSQQYKDVLTAVGLTVDQIEKLEAGELKPQEAAQSIQEFTTILIKSDKSKLDSIINPHLEDRDKKYLQKIKNLLNLSEEDVLNRDPIESLELGIKKKKEEMLAEYQNTNDAQLVEKNNRLQEEVSQLRRELDDFKMNSLPKLEAEYKAKDHAREVKSKLRDWLKDTYQFSVTPKFAEGAFHQYLEEKGFYVDTDSTGSKLILLSKDTKTAPLVDPSVGTGVLLLDTFAKQFFIQEKLIKQSNADDATSTQNDVWTKQSVAVNNIPTNKQAKLLGLDSIQKAQERDRLNSKQRAIA